MNGVTTHAVERCCERVGTRVGAAEDLLAIVLTAIEVGDETLAAPVLEYGGAVYYRFLHGERPYYAAVRGGTIVTVIDQRMLSQYRKRLKALRKGDWRRYDDALDAMQRGKAETALESFNQGRK